MKKIFQAGILLCLFHAFLFASVSSPAQEGKDRFSAYRELYADSGSQAPADSSKASPSGLPTGMPSGMPGGFPGSSAGFQGMGVPGFGVSAPSLNVTAKVLSLPEDGKPGKLEIFAQIPDGFKIYSLTQETGGPFPSKIHLTEDVTVQGKILSEPAPHSEKDELTWGDITIESHSKSVRWMAEFQWNDAGTPPAQISGSVEAQMCDANSCLPPKKFPFTAPVPALEKVSDEVPNPASAEHPEKKKNTEPEKDTVQEPAPASTETADANEKEADAEEEPIASPKPLSSEENAAEAVSSPAQNAAEAGETAKNSVPAEDPAESDETDGWEKPSSADYSLAIILAMAYLGGLILNLMPCVLPVIAPKLHSFIKQSGEARGRIFLLNVAYTVGLLTVLWLLAALSRIADLTAFLKTILPESAAAYLPTLQNMGWGQQFTYPGFVIFMIALVFVMGLSFLGVWEIPIPGMVASGKLGKMQRKEGFLGAYCMGILTTLLATPCVGPYLGPVFGWVMTQEIWVSFVTFTVIGLGLGTPYLVIGAFPVLIRFLPKPGEWMETLKEVMGFFFLGTVVWLFYVLPGQYTVPTLGLMVALWFACWLIGKTTLSGASREAVLASWAAGIIFSAIAGFVLFSLEYTHHQTQYAAPESVSEDEIPWRPFSIGLTEELRAEDRILFIDFTARWCATCQTNSKFAIETPAVAEFIRSNEIVPLLADWSEPSKEIEQTLERFGRNSIPLIVIWIPGQMEPILIDGIVSESNVLSALEHAVEKAQESQKEKAAD